jgi:hypothetical protein
LEENYVLLEESTIESPTRSEIDDRNNTEQTTVQVSSTGKEALSEPGLEPVIEDGTLTSIPLEEYKELYPKAEVEPNPFVVANINRSLG